MQTNLVTANASSGASGLVAQQGYGSVLYDAFGRLRVSEPHTLFESKQLYDKAPMFWDEQLTGGATSVHYPVDAETLMSVGTTGDKAIRQTFARFNYHAAVRWNEVN